ncbi:MAG: hypothetical protein G8D66_18950, partial [gamma proteobacterium symbiont of Ctena orbiculata]
MTNPIFKHSLWALSECLVSPATPYIGMPEIQESDLKMKSKAWKYATAIVVVFIIFNPEMIELGPVNTNPMHPVVPEKAPIKAHPKGTSFGA